MKLTTTQVTNFQQSLVSELESHVWDFIKSYTAQLCDEDTFVDEYEALRDQLLESQEGLTISFNWLSNVSYNYDPSNN